ncbi:MAG TPA: hypothetical protein VG457_04805, partial [Planctomycetota bacterium]|nr:hypothetical protein [Planctomycetota bacterium]
TGKPGPQGKPPPSEAQSGGEGPESQGSDNGNGTPGERQGKLLQGIDSLLNTNGAFPPATEQALREARELAGKSLGQLSNNDEAGAREPAAGVAEKLRDAVAQMNAAGAKDTRRAMEDGMRGLNDLKEQLDKLARGETADGGQGPGDLARKLGEVRKQLEDAADRQQDAGSADGARRLEDLADSIGRQGVQEDLEAMARAGADKAKAADEAQKVGAMAAEAAHGVFPGQPNAQDFSALLDALEKSRANLGHLAQLAGGTQEPVSARGGAKPGPEEGGQGPGENPTGAGSAQAANPDVNAHPQGAPGASPTTGGNGNQQTAVGPGGNVEQAYAETIADIKDEAQIAAVLDPNATVSGTLGNVIGEMAARAQGTTRRDIVNAYVAVAHPMDRLIDEMRKRLAQALRQEVIRQADMDDAPAAYRPSVSDYFEAMSRDYQPKGSEGEPAKP